MENNRQRYWNMDRMVYLQAALAVLGGISLWAWVDPRGIWLTVFAGANLLQASLTGVCPATFFYKKLGVPAGTVFAGADGEDLQRLDRHRQLVDDARRDVGD
ncbi:MAG: YgaP family membrane protein, partial [Alkalispirochaeta sp.]